jgi:hypothetical protein
MKFDRKLYYNISVKNCEHFNILEELSLHDALLLSVR